MPDQAERDARGHFTRRSAAAYGQRGGKTTVQRYGRDHMRRLGLRGFWATVNRHWDGNPHAYVNYLIRVGLAATDPVPQNGAFLHDRHLIRVNARAGIGCKLPPGWCPPAYPDDMPPPF